MAKNLTIYFPPSNFKGPTATQKWGKERGKKHNRKILVCGALRRGQRKMWLSNRQICFPYAHSVGKSNTSSRKNWIRMTVIFSFLFVTKFSLTWLELEFHLIPWAGCCSLESSKLLNSLSLEVFFDTVTRASVSWCFLIWILNITKNCWCCLKE